MDEVILRGDSLCYSYGSHPVLFDVNLELHRGEYLSIVGPNGSGKSTLFRLLCGQRSPASGRVRTEGREVQRLGITERARRFSIVQQKEENAFPFSCLEMVLLGLHPFRSRFGEPTARQLDRVLNIMTRTGILQLRDQPVTGISGGEYQRVILARSIAQSPKVLFLDEAMSELDIGAKIEMIKYLRALASETGMAVLAVNHDLSAAWRHSDTVLALQEGKVAGCGPPGEVMDRAFFADVFGVEAEILNGKGFLIRDTINTNKGE